MPKSQPPLPPSTSPTAAGDVGLQLDLQIATDCTPLPHAAQMQHWATAALVGHLPGVLSVRIVDSAEMQDLNAAYRHKNKPTNVLSFPMDDMPDHSAAPLLGDLVLCAPVIAEEAREGALDHTAHWAHLIVHGCLHLLGYDHEEPTDAVIMESKEVDILANLGFPSPYTEGPI